MLLRDFQTYAIIVQGRSISKNSEKPASGLLLPDFSPLTSAYLAGVAFLRNGHLGLFEAPHVAIVAAMRALPADRGS